MKITIFLTSILLMFFDPSVNYGQNLDRLLSSNSSTVIEAKCTGSAYCNACKNCSRCAHCNSGGSCGVCEGRNYNTRHNTRQVVDRNNNSQSAKKSKHQSVRTNNYYNNYDRPSSSSTRDYSLQKLLVNVAELNLRSKPNTNGFVICKLSYLQELILLEIVGDWLKVQVVSNDKIGYVFNKYVFIKN